MSDFGLREIYLLVRSKEEGNLLHRDYAAIIFS